MIKDYLKVIIEAINLNVPRRIGVSIGCLIILICKFFVDKFQHKDFFDIWCGLVFTVLVFSLFTAIADIYEENKKKKIEAKKSKFKKNYLLSLKGKQLNIVKSLYANEHHRGYLTDNDTDVLTLISVGIIIQTKKYNYFYSKDNTGEVDNRDVRHLCILAPFALDIINQYPQRFK